MKEAGELSAVGKIFHRMRQFRGRSGMGPRLARGAFWSTGGGVFSGALTLLQSIVLARILGVGDFGKLGLVYNTVGMFGALAGFGLGMGTAKHVANLRRQAPEEMWAVIRLSTYSVLATSGLVALVLWFAARGLAIRYLGDSALTTAIRIGVALLCLNAWNGVQVGVLTGLERFRGVALIRAVNVVVSLCGATLGARWHGVNGALVGAAVGVLVACLLSRFLVYRSTDVRIPRVSVGRVARRLLLDTSFPMFLAGLLPTAGMWYVGTLLARSENGYSQMGIFNAANSWFTIVAFGANCLVQPLLPIFASGGSASGGAEDRLLGILLRIVSGAGALVALAVGLCAPWIMRLYGAEFASGYWTLIVVALTGLLYCLCNLLSTFIMARRSGWLWLLLQAIWTGVLAIGATVLGTATSLAYATSRFTAYAVQVAIEMGLTRKSWAAPKPVAESR